jgi:uncharacterized membrane protein YhaH (DUF805 family)
MGFSDAVKRCFSRYVQFEGRAARPEYWWFALFVLLVSAAARILGDVVNALTVLVTLLPSIAVGVRRLHDTGRSGFWLLLWFVPVVGWIIVLIFLVQPGSPDPNAYGPPDA